MVDLGVFTAAELRAGGINGRGFLQPLLPAPEEVDQQPANRAAAEGLARRGLLARGPSGWRAVGRYERVLEAAAVARSLVAVWPADPDATDPDATDPDATGESTPRLALGCLGITRWVLDLCPESPGYRARLVETPAAAVELADYVGALAERAPESPGDGADGLGDGIPQDRADPPTRANSASDLDPEWAAVEGLLDNGVAAVRIETASISQPAGPLLQHRLTVLSTDAGDWLLMGTREGDRAGRQAAPMAHVQLGRLLEDLLSGSAPAL